MRAGLLLTVSLLLSVAGTAAAASAPKVVVDQPGGAAELWSGAVLSDGPRVRNVPECQTVACDAIRLKVKLPHDVWEERSGGVHVAIRFVDGTPDDNLALAVYRDGRRVGSSTATVGTRSRC